MRLSVLDQSPILRGHDARRAIEETLALARRADELGYYRYWLAEHHAIAALADPCPEVLVARLGAETKKLRIGTGGVLLPYYSAFRTAEAFRMLEALYPGRIDLGIGRAPGGDMRTAQAVAGGGMPDASHFPQQIWQLCGHLDGTLPKDHPFQPVRVQPEVPTAPEVWLLGSSDYSAILAGKLGLPFSFAHHFSPRNTVPAMRLYREHFHPSDALAEPYAMVAVAVVCAEDDERARYLAGPSRLSMARLRTGMPTRLPSPEEAAAHDYSPGEESAVGSLSGSAVIGGPETVREGLADLASRTGANELMLTTNVYDPADRIRSFELVASLAGLAPEPAAS